MTDLTITATQVLPDATGGAQTYNAGAAITAGQTVYIDAATGTAKLADADASAATAVVAGIALNGAAIGQPVKVQTSGKPVLGAGAAVVIGAVYVQSAGAGGIAPAADLATGMRTSVIGVGAAGNAIALGIVNSGQVHA